MDKHEMIKNRIIAAAKEVLNSEEGNSFTISDICKKCKISKNTFYKHFSSKKELIKYLNNGAEHPEYGAENMTELIIENAKKLVFEKGFDNLDMNELAAMVGIKRTTLYSYFSSSAEIAQYILSNELKKREIFEQIVDGSCKDSIERLNSYIDYQLKLIDNEQITRLIIEMIAKASKNENIKNRLIGIESFTTNNLMEFIECGKEEQVFDSSLDSKINASLIYMLSYGITIYRYLHPNSDTLEKLKPYISSFIINGLKNNE